MESWQFNIRVYAIIFDHVGENILLSDEFINGQYITKFPGGGLNWGEGTIDCLKREAMEEFGQEINVISHFYTTDFFQKALFFENQQLISIYYKAKFIEDPRFPISTGIFDFPDSIQGEQAFRWLPMINLSSGIFTFPIDKKVAEMLRKH